jgi:protein dithiol oxidoreductase (disulfide-forming)
MNCETIAAILDDHRTARLGAAEQQAVGAHLGGCAACAAGWAAHEALHRESMDDPRPELLARVLTHVTAVGPCAQPRAAVRRSWAALAAAAAVAAVVVGAASFYPWGSRSDGALEIAAPPTAFVAGRDYEILAAPAPVTADNRIPVIEFFDYGCFHCYTFEAELASWEQRAESYVALTRVPITFTPAAELHARAFYTAEALGKLDALHPAFYEAIHAHGNPLVSGSALAKLFASFGVDPETFTAVFNSSEVDANLQQAAALARQYGISSWPAIVVAGRYSTRRLEVVDQLVAEEARRKPCAGAGCPMAPRGPRNED